MDYHGRIMNIQGRFEKPSSTYAIAHRDARLAAADIAADADRTIAALVVALERIKRRAKPHPEDSAADFARNLMHVSALADSALALAKEGGA